MIVFVHAHDSDIIDMKSFVKLPNRLHPLYSNKEMKSFFFLPCFRTHWHQGPTGTLHMVSEHKVTTLGPDGLINMQVWCELCDFLMRYYNAYYERKYCWTHCWDGLRIICNACTKIQKKDYLFKDTIRLAATTLSQIHLCCLCIDEWSTKWKLC